MAVAGMVGSAPNEAITDLLGVSAVGAEAVAAMALMEFRGRRGPEDA